MLVLKSNFNPINLLKHSIFDWQTCIQVYYMEVMFSDIKIELKIYILLLELWISNVRVDRAITQGLLNNIFPNNRYWRLITDTFLPRLQESKL